MTTTPSSSQGTTGSPPGISGPELRRQIVHAGFGLVALALRWLTTPWAVALAGSALLMNLFILPRLPMGRAIFREGESRFGGIVLYPLVVMLLIVLFPIHVAAAAWIVLAFGDGASNVCGRMLGRRKLPWNPRKSWAGTFGFVVVAAPIAAGMLFFVSANPEVAYLELTLGRAAVIAICGAAVGAIVESLPLSLDDNVSVGFSAALAMWGVQAWILA